MDLKLLKMKMGGFLAQALFILVVGVVIVLVMAHVLNKKVDSIQSIRAEIAENEKRISSRSELQQQKGELKDKLPQLATLVPQEKNIGATITQLDVIADRFGLKVTTKIGDKILESGIAYIPLTMTTTTTLDTLREYVRALEQLPFIVQVSALDFNGKLGSAASATLRAKLFINPTAP